MTVPYAHCKGILMGTLTMELGGKISIDCEKTGYYTEIEFKLKVSRFDHTKTGVIYFYFSRFWEVLSKQIASQDDLS